MKKFLFIAVLFVIVSVFTFSLRTDFKKSELSLLSLNKALAQVESTPDHLMYYCTSTYISQPYNECADYTWSRIMVYERNCKPAVVGYYDYDATCKAISIKLCDGTTHIWSNTCDDEN